MLSVETDIVRGGRVVAKEVLIDLAVFNPCRAGDGLSAMDEHDVCFLHIVVR